MNHHFHTKAVPFRASTIILGLGTPAGKSAYFSSTSIHTRDQDDVDNDGILINDFGRTGGFDFVAKKKTRPLKLRKKFYEFYAAPISKYICHTIAYVAFLATYTYICLVKTPIEPSGETCLEFGKKPALDFRYFFPIKNVPEF